MRRVVAQEEAMVLIVVRRADDGRRRLAEQAAMLPAGMPDDARDLVVDLVREQHHRGDRQEEMSEEPIGLNEAIVEEGVAVVRPHGRRAAEMMPAMDRAIERLPVQQAVEPGRTR